MSHGENRADEPVTNFSQKHLDLISQIYDLPQHPGRWSEVLDEFGLVMNASLAATAVYDPNYDPHELNAICSSFDQAFLDEHRKQVSKGYRSAFARMTENPVREFKKDLEMLGMDSYEEYEQRPMIQWLNREYNIYHGAASCLNLDRSWTNILFVMFDKNRGPVTRQEIRTGNIFLDHFAKSMEIGRVFGELKNRFQATLAALDRLHLGVLILSPNGSIVLSNREADRILDAGDGLIIDQQGRPCPLAEGQRNQMQEAVRQAVRTARGQYDRAETLLTLPRKTTADPYLVEVAPFSEEGDIDRLFKGCLMYVIDPENFEVVSTEGMQSIYGLTDAESEIARLVAQGMQTDDIADARGLTRETVRSYIKQILQKTGARNRSQFVRLALNINLPIDPVSI